MAVATTEFTARETEIPGLLIFDITSIGDERGWFQEKFHRAKLVAAGLPESFEVVQTSVSYNRQAGVTRGFHAEPWDKYISVVAGQVFCAFLDLRRGENFGRVVTVEIDNGRAVFLPRGVANSFQTLVDDTYYLYSVNRHWSADQYDEYVFVNLADPEVGVHWPIPLDKAVISERDRGHVPLADARPFEASA
ncbi:dTDP-4-dehydrorhamnose 3,5-epimerase family protein [Parafrankia sp. EUN1f]|uniref:dTDP-4-dehydrorhamnose 3,5-epimerase family protein n=1 Tax=Parafrankia sp. EUN1f TaxID=102897 RepID=UPI0001C43A97|nr:dTDP-4-dehydrorhamnose 3,5-epimerase family protein [Parafrankia sp. EUN1f]EFC83554.1 dTDP-4-dehydrorhamnose 3,5-epimerase [Parafrankia sp. EUN1f]